MRGVTAFGAGIVAALLAAGAASAQFTEAEPWPTTDFEVRTEPTPGWEEYLDTLDPETKAAILNLEQVEAPLEARVKIEAWLKRVAQHLEDKGFRPPHLSLVPSRTSPPKPNGVYEAYIYNFPGDNPAFYHGGCTDLSAGESVAYIRADSVVATHGGADREAVFDGGDITKSGEATLAHELFHAVQASYPLFQSHNCKSGTWLGEATAEGFEVYAVEELLGRTFAGADYEDGLLPRAYDSSLYVAPLVDGGDPDTGYDTGSFWLYLAEMAAAGPGKIPELNGGARDISYLHDIFQIGRAGFDQASELTWLKDALALRFRRRLPGVFSEFITQFAGYVPARAGAPGDVGAWREELFDYCLQQELTQSAPRVDFSLSFAPVSAQCVAISLDTTDEVELFVFARNRADHLSDAEALKNVFVGVPGTHVVDRADLTLPGDIAAENEDVVAMWRVPFDPLVDDAVILSSVATITADNPHNGPIQFTILHPTWLSSLTQKPSRPPPAERGTGEHGELNEEKADAASRSSSYLYTFSSTSRSSGSLSRRPDYSMCEEPFKYQVCGPYMAVSLELTPGSLFDLGATSGRGGLFAQFAGNLLAADHATGGGMAGLMEWVERQQSIPGHQITMTFPMVDYGFTGSFNNAIIEAQIDKRTMWRTVGPSDAMPGPGQMYAYSGTVTIEEYTPEILRGTYSGGLVDGADGVDGGDDPTLPIRHSLSGSFVIAAPLMDDDRTHVINPIEYDGVMEDFEIVMPGLNTPLDDILARAREQAAENPARNQSPTGSRAELCDCSCNYVELASPVCQDHCAWAFRACAGEAYTPAPAPAAMTAGEEAAAIAELRRSYYDFMVENDGRERADIFIQIFDSLPDSYKEKRMWLEVGGAPEFIKWEREQAGEAPPEDYVPSADEAAQIADLRQEFHDYVAAKRSDWAAKNFVEVYDIIPGGVVEKRAWIAEVEPEFTARQDD